MKKLTRFLPLLLLTIALLALPACAHFTKSSTTEHALVKYGAAVPPDWRVIVPTGQLNLPADETNGYTDFAFVGETNSASGLFANHPRIFVAYRETWTDRSKGGGTFLFTDPQASQVSSSVNNQAALAGSHEFAVGAVSATISSNAVVAITAVGSAGGNLIGAAAKAAAGNPLPAATVK